MKLSLLEPLLGVILKPDLSFFEDPEKFALGLLDFKVFQDQKGEFFRRSDLLPSPLSVDPEIDKPMSSVFENSHPGLLSARWTVRTPDRFHPVFCCGEEVKDEQDYLFLPQIIQNELNLIENKDEREEGQKFWMKIWKPISKKADKLKSGFIMEVAKETGLSKETVRKLLRKARKESGD